MGKQFMVYGLGFILHLVLLLNLSSSYEDSFTNNDDHQPLVVFEYNKMAEIEKHCSNILSLGSKFELTDSKSERIRNELTFYNGDWEQENNGLAPLMPFDSTNMPSGMGSNSLLKLINFEVKDIKSLDHVQNGVGLGGIMSIGITRSKSFSYDLRTMFTVKPGMSVLTIVFEGVYVETEESKGERLLCMVGNKKLPSQKWFLDEQNLDWSHENQLLQDDQLVLVLKYPKVPNLTAQGIQGEMRNLQEKESFKFFDKVLISSNLGRSSNYQFNSDQLYSCNIYAHQKQLMEDGANNLSSSDFCRIFQDISNEVLNILVDNHTNLTDSRKLGPFVLENEVMNGGNNYRNLKLMIQKVKCKEQNPDGQTDDAKVSAVFRVFPVHVALSTTSSRTGLSGMTLLAEGRWNSSTGQLCMVGYVPKGTEAKVSMYFPRALSIKQRSFVFGSIEGLFSTLHMNVVQRPFHLEYKYGWYAGSFLSYNYSRIKQADEFRKRSQSFNIIGIPHKLIYSYPTIQEAGGFFSLSQIYDLTKELYIDTELSTSRKNLSKASVKLEVLSIGPFLARYDFLYKVRYGEVLKDTKTIFDENGFHNVSLHLDLTYSSEPLASASTSLKSVKSLFMEGLYDPQTGVMYLIGCGLAKTGASVEWGLDCLIEVKIQYPPRNLQWLRDPSIEISIKSQRNAYDSLYFTPKRIKQTITKNMFIEKEHEEDVAFRMLLEGVVRMVVLSVEIAIIWSQKHYMDQNVRVASSVCLNMFVVEILSYCILFIMGEEIPLSSKKAIFYKQHAYDLHAYQPMLTGIDYAAKFLALIVVNLNSRLFLKVTYSRKRLNDEDSSKAPLTLGDRSFFLSLLKKFAFVCLVILVTSLSFPTKKSVVSMEINPTWLVRVLIELALVLHDISLLSQIVENWRRKNHAKSLRKVYYVGLSLLKIMVKVYDRIRSPISDPYIVNFLDTDILALVSLVIILHVQQNFSYFCCTVCLKVGQLLNLRKLMKLPFKSRQQ